MLVVVISVLVFGEQGLEEFGVGPAHALLHLDDLALLLLGTLAISHTLDEAVKHGQIAPLGRDGVLLQLELGCCPKEMILDGNGLPGRVDRRAEGTGGGGGWPLALFIGHL